MIRATVTFFFLFCMIKTYTKEFMTMKLGRVNFIFFFIYITKIKTKRGSIIPITNKVSKI